MSTKPPYSSMAEPSTTALCPFLLVGISVYTHGHTHLYLLTNPGLEFRKHLQTISVYSISIIYCLGYTEPPGLMPALICLSVCALTAFKH